MARVSPSVPALVTGASSGIGAEFARQLAARGHDVTVVARRRERLEALRERLEADHGVHVSILVADLETAAGREAVATAVERRDGPWLVVNNAGFGTRGHVAELPVDREMAEVAVNVVAMHQLPCVALRHNLPHRDGGILTVASMAGFQPLPYFATYAATKAFMLHFSEALAVEAKGTGVRVTALCPGPVRTEFVEGVFDAEAKLFGAFFIDAERCVADALRAFDRGRVICVPGVLLKASTLAVPLVPRSVLRGASGRIQKLLGIDRTRERDDRPARAPAATRRAAAGGASAGRGTRRGSRSRGGG